MASKDKKEMRAFERAQKAREPFVVRLTKCSSQIELKEILKDYKQAKGKDSGKLKTSHASDIKKLDDKIQVLIAEKKLQFKVVPKATAGVDQKDVTVAAASVVQTAPDVTVEPVVIAASKPVKAVKFNSVINVHHAHELSSFDPDLESLPVNRARETQLVAVRAQLQALKDKVTYFDKQDTETKDEKYNKSHAAAQAIVGQLEELTNQYARNQISISFYKSEAKNLMDVKKNTDAAELHAHRGFFLKAVQAVVEFICKCLSVKSSGSLGLFKTDSAKKMNGFANALNQVQDENELDLNLDAICKC